MSSVGSPTYLPPSLRCALTATRQQLPSGGASVTSARFANGALGVPMRPPLLSERADAGGRCTGGALPVRLTVPGAYGSPPLNSGGVGPKYRPTEKLARYMRPLALHLRRRPPGT